MSMIQFKKYNSIENTFDTEFMDKVSTEVSAEQEFVVQEKVHGANVSLMTDGITADFGKRTGLVEADEKFYDHEELFERYTPKLLSLFASVKEIYSDTKTLAVFGEMFGGKYPHRDVQNRPNTILIQKGVYYCPHHEFYAFDLYITNDETGRFLNLDEANAFFEQEGFFYAKTLFRGTLKECIKYPNNLPSMIPGGWGCRRWKTIFAKAW
jgi:Rnl2 family RNA ligase